MLTELYENGLTTSEDVQEMKRMKGNLMTRLVFIQCGKEADTVTKTAEITRRHDFSEDSKMLTGRVMCMGTCTCACLCVVQPARPSSLWPNHAVESMRTFLPNFAISSHLNQ